MSINLVRYEGNTVLPRNDVDLMKRIFTVNGFLSGCELSHLGNNLIRITSGKGIIQGGDFEIMQEDIQVVLPSGSVGNGYLYIKVDLSDTTTPIKILSILTDEGTAPAWVQDVNFYETNGVYELPILRYVCTNTSITSIENLAQYISSPIVNLEENEADLWVSNGSYVKGDIVLYDVNKKLYRYTAPLPYGTSIPTNPLIWTQVNIGDEIVLAKKPATVGIGTTVATSLTNGQVFTAPSDGVYEIKTTFSTNTGYIIYAVSNGQGGTVNSTANNGYGHYAKIDINAGQTLTVSNVFSLATVAVKFFPQYA